MGTKAIDAQMDGVAVSFLYDFRDAGVLLISKDFKGLSAEIVIINVHKMGILAIKHKLEATSMNSLESLLIIAHAASSKEYWKYLSEKAYNYFWICAAHFEKNYPEKAGTACEVIKSKKIDINQIFSKEMRDIINRQNPELVGFVDKFINRFNSN